MSFDNFIRKPHVKLLFYAEILIVMMTVFYSVTTELRENLDEFEEEELEQIADDNIPDIVNIIGLLLIVGVAMSIISVVYSFVR